MSNSTKFKYLALGDSYTIGEGVEPQYNFPSQVKTKAAEIGLNIEDLKIIAKTGWTTDELENEINDSESKGELHKYDLVTLLIGVNNQYRGRTTYDYKQEFERLLNRALRLADMKKERVIVLSIPDWGVTPYAGSRDTKQIAAEIDEYNKVNLSISQNYGVHYLNITPSTRKNATLPGFIVADGLHPSEKEYNIWASSVVSLFATTV